MKILLTFILWACIAACDPLVTFTESQPADTGNLSKFTKRLQGQYLSLADNSTLSISDKSIQRIYDFELKVHPNQLDSTAVLSGDTIIDLQTHEKTIVTHDGDSLISHVHYTDTLFSLDDKNVVRKFKGYYFLNTYYEKSGWEVTKIQLTRGQLIMSRISAEHEIDNLKEIIETANDTIPPYNFSATKKQFKDFVKKDGFSASEIFVRIKGG